MSGATLEAQQEQDAAEASRRRGFVGWLADKWSIIALVVLGSAFMFWTILHHGLAMSPIDEWAYIDYLVKFPTQWVIHQGELFGVDARELMSCYGIKVYGPMGPPCGGDYSDAAAYPYAGVQWAHLYSPAYFAPTWLIATIVHGITGIHLLIAARLTGILWLAATLIVMHMLFREFGVSRFASFAIGLLFIASPYAWWTYSYMSTDAPSALVGVALLLVARRYTTGRTNAWWLVAIGALAVAFKSVNIIAFGMVGIYLLLWFLFTQLGERPWMRSADWRTAFRGRGPLGWLPAGVLTILAGFLVQTIWLANVHANAVGDPAAQGVGIPLTVEGLLAQVTNFLPDTINSNALLSGTHDWAYPVPPWAVAPFSWVCVTGVIGAAWYFRGRTPQTALTLAVLVSALVAAPALAIVLNVSFGEYYLIPPRYGGPLLPAFLLTAGLLARNRFVTGALALFAGVFYLTALVLAPLLA